MTSKAWHSRQESQAFLFLITAGVHTVAGAVSGAINSAITGSDVGMGMLTGAVGAGLGSVTGGALSYLKINQFGYQLVARTVMGGVAGGVVSEIYGGNFWQGAAQGAGTAAAGFLFNCAMSRYKLINQSANRQVWIDTQTGKQVPAPGKYVDPLTEYANNFINDAVIPALPYAAGAAVTLATDNPKLGLMVYGWTGTLMGLLFDRPAGIPLPGIRRINPIINRPEAW